ncbi:MAG: hypothetical protein ACREKN_01370 [Longimicrobiaceae bacterium]
MPKLTLAFGALLIVLGLSAYFGTGGVSVTALIPAFFGALFILLGWLATRERLRKHAMHGAAALALLGVLGTARGVPAALALLGGGTVERPGAAVTQAVMFLLSLVFLLLCVRSFVAARRA